MVYLEEHGCILSPSYIVWAAQNQFLSYEKANEIFNYLVNEKGLSVNAINKYGATPLHYACLNGSIFGVKWLMEHQAVINSVDTDGETPFMWACESSINRSAKVRYLGEKGADCRAKDDEGKTALFYATTRSECKDDVKDVLRYLVIEKRIDINSVDEEGRTPLVYACKEDPSFVVIQQLNELGADVSLRDNNEQNALHMAAQRYPSVDKSIIDLLIEKGCDVTRQDKDGKTPYEVSKDGKIRAHLRQHYDAARFSVLQRETVRPDSIKVCVVGDEMAGKTTYVNSLLQLNQPPPKDEDRTPGVDIHNCDNEEVGKGSWWDFGSQPTFHSAHGLFFRQSNTMFNLILPVREEEKMTSEILLRLIEKGRYWCAFSKASMRTLSSDQKSLIRLIVIFNLIDFNGETGSEVRFQLKEVVEILRKEYGNTFEISHVIEMDCSKSQSACMKDCRSKLKKIREEMLSAAEGVPKLCQAIEQNISLPDEKRKIPLAYFLTTKEFEKWVAEEVGITLSDDEKEVAVEYLDSSGIIINLGRRICVQPVWLCHNVIGPLLAPPYFVVAMPAKKSAMASKEDMESALRAFENHLKQKGHPSPFVATVDEAIEVLLYLELCISIEDKPGMYQIPALLFDSISSDTWNKDSTLDVYRGQRYECAHPVDFISPSSFVILQCRCYHMPNVRHKAWKNGIKLIKIVDDKEVECLITMGAKMSHYCIDVILRWSSKDDCEAVAKEFLNELKSMISRACDERSPGVVLNWFYIDSSHLRELNENPAIYSSSEVDQKMKDPEKTLDHKLFSARPEGEKRCRIKDLVIIVAGTTTSASGSFPADDDPVSDSLLKACAAVDGTDLDDMCMFFDIGDDDLHDICEKTKGIVARRFKALKLWKKREKAPKVSLLLGLFDQVGVGRHVIQKKYEQLCSRK
ncbi:death-associated protein kinase 1-like isoform X2 [Oscarella lobularis]